MCLIAFAIGAAPDRPLWLAANRDEDWQRPTAPLHRWVLDDGTELVAGRDLRDGGTWLGISPNGRVAMLTNVRQAEPAPGRRSRGLLVTQALQVGDVPGWMGSLAPADFGGFNLVVGDLNHGHWQWLSNRHPAHPHEEQAPALHQRRLGPGLYGLSNASLDTPWPKTVALKQALADALQTPDAPLTHLAPALTRTEPAHDTLLPASGVPLERERALSSPFVHLPERGYGTRSSLLLRVSRTVAGARWQAELDEWTHDQQAPQPHLNPARHRQERLTAA